MSQLMVADDGVVTVEVEIKLKIDYAERCGDESECEGKGSSFARKNDSVDGSENVGEKWKRLNAHSSLRL